MGIAGYSRLRGILVIVCLGILTFSACTNIPKIIVLNDPLSADEHISLGLSYELKGEYDPAIEEYDKALRKDKKNYIPLYYSANVYYRKKEYGQAEDYYNKALKIVPENGDIHNNLSWVYIDTGRFEEAEGEIEKALKIKKDPYYMDTRANLYDRMGRYEDAISVLQESLTVTPQTETDLLYNEYKLLGDVYEKMGKHEEAEDALKRAEEYKEKLP